MEQVGNVRLLQEAGLSYSLAGTLPAVVSFFLITVATAVVGEGYAQSEWYKYCAFLIPQLCFAATVIFYLVRTKEKPRALVGGCKWQYFLIAVALQFGLLCLGELNSLFIRLLQMLGYEQSPINLPDLTGWKLLPAIFVIAVLPAIFEELLFRGILTGGMRKSGWGCLPSVLLCGALFSVFHTNPAQTVYQFVCGACFALVAWRCGSVLPTVLAHFLNNAYILILEACGVSVLPLAVKIPLYICSGICLAATLAYLIFFDKNNRQKGKFKGGNAFFLYAAFGIAVAAFSWLTVFLVGVA